MAIEVTKRCIKCGEEKSYADFYFRQGKPRSQCKNCSYNPEYQRSWKYGLTAKEYAAILKRQDGHCALCQETRGLEIDHDPKCCTKRPTCGKCTRGLLCDRHNRALGFFTLEELKTAQSYLENSIENKMDQEGVS